MRSTGVATVTSWSAWSVKVMDCFSELALAEALVVALALVAVSELLAGALSWALGEHAIREREVPIASRDNFSPLVEVIT